MRGLFFGASTGLSVGTRPLVGASLLAMVANDNAYELDKRGALEPIASKPAPTRFMAYRVWPASCRCKATQTG
ncbi:hypothetical protein CD175_13160 [Pseudomonas laurylsulfatiphila]|uniref:Uncharacterized protein n=1 Tax=Pseudomonas laurylsulfatiphila TaxID=2011015 RepID=A0A2S6FMU3_9PSED|nr:hypothetical protein CD175_13160 [Pseudomonas laurylsulfatiphila]